VWINKTTFNNNPSETTPMTGHPDASGYKRNIWMRCLFMLLMGFAFQVCGTVLCVVTVVQFVMVLVNSVPNARLVSLGHGLGSYLRQIVNFLTFATEEIPFPFGDWPAEE
jgi:hypothetical protein